jgi:hypothetical protein
MAAVLGYCKYQGLIETKLEWPNQTEHCVPKEVWKQMRYLSKILIVAVGLLAIGGISSSVRANDMLVGSFTLHHPTQWNKTLLPAGTYKFKLVRTQTDANLLVVSGEKQSMDIYVFAQSACETCRNAGLTLEVQGDHRAVTSLSLPGFHVDFSVRGSLVDAKAQADNATPYSEQIDVSVNPH